MWGRVPVRVGSPNTGLQNLTYTNSRDEEKRFIMPIFGVVLVACYLFLYFPVLMHEQSSWTSISIEEQEESSCFSQQLKDINDISKRRRVIYPKIFLNRLVRLVYGLHRCLLY